MKLNIFFRLEKAWVGTRQKLVSSLNYVFCFRENLNLQCMVSLSVGVCRIVPMHSDLLLELVQFLFGIILEAVVYTVE